MYWHLDEPLLDNETRPNHLDPFQCLVDDQTIHIHTVSLYGMNNSDECLNLPGTSTLIREVGSTSNIT